MGRWNLIERRLERFTREPVSVRNAAGVIVLATAVIVVGAGVLITMLDSEEYPKNVAGRLVGAFVMLEGIAFVAIITAVITSSFVARATREHEAAVAKEELSDRELIERRFDELEQKLDALASTQGPH